MNILTASRLFTFVREGMMYEISTACFIYRSIFAVQALRKRRVQGHCAAYHFRIQNLDWKYFRPHFEKQDGHVFFVSHEKCLYLPYYWS